MLLLKATGLIVFGAFAIGMGVALITNELGVIFAKINAYKDNKINKKEVK